VPAADQNPDCTTTHHTTWLDIVKVVDRTVVDRGGAVAFTITATNVGGSDFTAADPAVIVDDLSDVLDDATWLGTATATSGSLSFDDDQLTWTGPLAVGDTVTITYSVRVDKTTGSGQLNNTVVGPPASTCPPGSNDPDRDCETSTEISPPPAPPAPTPPGPPVPVTG
jgi:uncharacterized repeat protein (TIGR01451 family)